MTKVLTEARSTCPELISAIKAIDKLAYTRQYSEVFSDFIDWLIYQYSMPPMKENPLDKKYNKGEKTLFLDVLKNVQEESRKRINMWVASTPNHYLSSQWYDPLGRMYQCITSTYKSSAMGQYFTPESVCTMMAQMNINLERKKISYILDPAAGSGRLGLSAASHLLSNSIPSWITMNDLDPICTRMAAINMCLNGVIGEVVCSNGLDISGDSFRFAYRISPALAFIPEDQWEFHRMMVLMKTGQDVKKQYVLSPITYEQTFLKQANDQLLIEYKERLKIAKKEEKEKAMEDLKTQIRDRMKGSLFADDQHMINAIKLPSDIEKKKPRTTSKEKKNNTENNDNQGSLF